MIFLAAILFFSGSLLSQAMAAEVFTDRPDYPPGDEVIITGLDFAANEVVTVQVTFLNGNTPATPDYDAWNVTANSFGNFETTWIVPEDAVSETLLVTAEGQTSGWIATTTFTDATTLLYLNYEPVACAGSEVNVCATLLEQCGGGSAAPLPNRMILFFITEGNCGVDVGQSAYDTAWTDSNGVACSMVPVPDSAGTYSMRAKFLGEDKPGVGEDPNSACDPTKRIQLSASNACEEVTVTYEACNEPPVATCPGDTSIFACDLSPITISGFSCSDPDGNLETCVALGGTLSGDQVTFTPVVGANTITLIATDSLGAADTCYTIVTVTLNSAPTCNLPGDNSYFVCGDTTFTFPVSATDIDGNLTGCSMTSGSGSFDGSNWTFTTTGPGVYSASFTCTDDCGETCSGTVNITVSYNQAPVATCPGDTSIFVCDLSPITLSGFSCTDADGNLVSCVATGGTLSGDQVTFTPVAGVNALTLTATDACGATDVCQTNVTIVVNSAPVATCPGDATMFVCDLSPITISGFSSSDPDNNLVSCIVTGGALSGDQVTFTPVPGPNPITMICTDSCGVADTCQTVITVVLNSAPVATCPGDQTLFVCDLSPITISGFSCSDPDANLASCVATGGTLSGDQVTFTPAVGANVITLTATDDCGATDICQTTITVVLNSAPVATCPGDQTLFVCDLSPITISGFSCSDPDANLASCVATGGTLSGDQVTFTPVPGVNTITLTATDSCGATDVCQTNITVVLNSPPVASCPGDISQSFLCEPSEICVSGFSGSDPDGNLSGESVSLGTLSSGTVCFTPDTAGIYSIVYTVTDACGETDACTTHVTVSFVNQPPVATCPGDQTLFVCDLSPITISGFSCSDPDANLASCVATGGTLSGDQVTFTPVVGANVITLTATDDCGATDVCQTTITVVLNSPPVAVCPGDQTLFVCDLSPITISGFSSSDPDNNLASCTVTNGTLSGGQVTFTPVPGPNVITMICTDDCGAADTCQTVITVVLNSAPVATCPGDQTLFVCDLSPITINGFSCSDPDANLLSCAATGGTLSGDQVTFTPVPGVNTITLTATDSCGATDVCQTNITVVLNSPPVASCPGDVSQSFLCEPSEICVSGFSGSDPDDNLSGESVSLGTLSSGTVCFTPDTAGIYSIVYTVTDACGETDACTTHVTVSYVNQPPVATCPGDQTLFVCDLSPITVDGFSCSDPDGNLTSCVATGGTLSGTAVTFTPVVGDNFITLTATDDCGATDVCQTKITVSLNNAPVATCPGNVSLFVCDLSDITIGGFSCSDPDGNLTSCDVSTGTLAGDEVTFTPAPGVNTITLTATDACGATGTCQTQVTIILNQMPYFTAPDDDTRFLCATEELCYTLDFGDPDVPAYHSEPTAYLLDGLGTIAGHQLCFTPIEGVDTTYWFKIQVCDSCGTPSNPEPPSPPNSCIIDSFSVTITFNQAPMANCPPPLDTMLCALGPITISGFDCSDPDNNLVSCETVPGPLTGGSVTFTPVEGVNYIILTATDECGAVAVCTTLVTVIPNDRPVAACPANATYTLCDLEQICVSGFACSDPDDNLVSCEVVDQTLNNGEVCFMPVEGVNDLMLVATDECGAIDTCHTYITVTLLTGPSISDKTEDVVLCDPGDVCVGLPEVTGGTPPFTWTYEGRPVTDTVCVYFADDGTVSGEVVVTDSCGHSASATLTINATVNTAPTVADPGPFDPMFLCESDSIEIKLSIYDPDDHLTGSSKIGVLDLSDSTVTFYAGSSGRYCDTVIIADSCGMADSAYYCIDITINTPPECPSVSDIVEFQCTPTQICRSFMATDVDGNLAGCNITNGPGTLSNGQWCYTPTGDISTSVTIQCVDSCDEVCETSFNVDIDINTGPTANCPDNSVRAIPTLREICVTGFSCFDPDDNLVDCHVVVNGVTMSLVGDEVCFTPEWGDNTIYLIAEDACGEADTCYTTVMVTELTICPIVTIEKTHGTLQGHYEQVSITYQNILDGSLPDMGGFDFLIAYDASALAFVEAYPGQLLEDCGWEYFSYRYGVDGNCGNACPSGLLRIIAIAETNNGPNHPNCYGPPDTDPHELAKMKFFVTNDRTYECQYVPITFFWADCSDNSISSITGDSLILDSKIYDFEGNLIWDEDDDDLYPETARIPFIGSPDNCLEGDKLVPFRCLELYEGGIDIVCADSIDARGDVNCNGVANEVADAVMLTNYFISGLSAFGTHVEASIAASDVNADGIALSVADLVYLVRVITGDAPPFAKPILNNSLTITTAMTDNQLSVTYDASTQAGAVLLTFNIDGTIDRPVLGDGARGMDLEYGIQGNELRILVYDLGTNSIASGKHELLSIPVEGSLTLIGAEAADYYGSSLSVLTRTIPGQFALSQNRPNPFNPVTTISLSMPISGEWSITVYNINGQVVREYSGYDEAGTVQVTWDGTDNSGRKVASGIYLYRAVAGQYSETRKMVLMK